MITETLKLLIIDDEHLVRNLVKNCLDWVSMGFSIIGEASNAREGLDAVKRFKPDVIITDICMPDEDGIKLSKKIKEISPHSKIIVLTGYEEFEYAKESIKLGLDGFLLKPIDDEELMNVMMDLKARIHVETNKANELEELRKKINENLFYLRERFLNRLVHGDFLTEIEIQDQLEFLKIKTSSNNFQVAILEVEAYSNIHAYPEEASIVVIFQIMEIVQNRFNCYKGINIFYDNNHRIIILNSENEFDISKDCRQIIQISTNEINCALTIGISNWSKDLYNIPDCYDEAYEALRYRIIRGKNQLISINELDAGYQFNSKSRAKLDDDFKYYVRAAIEDQAIKTLNAYFSIFQHDDIPLSLKIQAKGCTLVSTLLMITSELNLSSTDIWEKAPFQKIFQIDTLPAMKDHLILLTKKVMIAIQRVKEVKTVKLVDDVRDYLIKNFHLQTLSLTKVACSFNVNPSYLSRIFKKETGKGFIEYLSVLRMEEAVKLFRETDLRSYEIADKVGYDDPHYFNFCFKKFWKVSVSQFKKSIDERRAIIK